MSERAQQKTANRTCPDGPHRTASDEWESSIAVKSRAFPEETIEPTGFTLAAF
jgi:hypothetical protein